MVQQITITADTPIALKPLIESAVQSELRMLELGIERTTQRLHAFEEQYALTSAEFEHRFETGTVDESLDFIEWAGEIKTYQLLKLQLQTLQELQLN